MPFVQSKAGLDFSGGSGTSVAVTPDSNITAGNDIVGGVTFGGTVNTADLTSITDNLGNTYSIKTPRRADTGNNQCIAMFHCRVTTGGAAVITANFAGNTYRGIWIEEHSGQDAAAFDGCNTQYQTGLGAGTDNISSGSITTTVDGCTIYGFSIASGGGTAITSAGTGFTQRNLDSSVADTSQESRIQATAGSVAATFSQSAGGAYRLTGVIALKPAAGGPDVDSTSTATPEQGSTLTITGTGFGASQGSGSVTIGGVTQTVTSWSDTSIDVTVNRGTNKFGVAVNVVVTDNALDPSAPFALTSLLPQAGWSYINLGTPYPVQANRLSATPDLASGDQINYEDLGGAVIVAVDATYSAVNTVRSFQFEVWTPGDGWGAVATQEIAPPALQRQRRYPRQRTHSKLWRREGWINTRLHRAGWFNKDLILPASGSTAQSATFSLNLAVQIAQAATASISTAVQAPQSATTAVNLAVQQALSAQAQVDAALQLARSAAASIDTAVQAARSATASIDVPVQAARSAGADLNLAVQTSAAATASIDAYVQAASEVAFAINLLVQEGHSLSAAIDIAVQAARSAGANVDLAVQLARSATAAIDTAVQQARSAGAVIDLAIQQARSAGFSVDLYVQAGFQLAAAIDTAVRFSSSASAAVDLAVSLARSATFEINTVVAVRNSVSAAIEAAVRASAQATVAINLYVEDPSAVVHGSAARERGGNHATLTRPRNIARLKRR